MNRTQTGSALRTTLITIAATIAVLAFLITRLPQGFSDDLSRIGRGANIVVLVHSKSTVRSQNLMSLLNQVRPDYAGKVEWLVADIETESGKAFVREQQLNDSILVFFGPDGTRRGLLEGAVDENGLRMALDTAFSLKP
jgi:predicted polyphosphate/ATP-dependent NAD kinase